MPSSKDPGFPSAEDHFHTLLASELDALKTKLLVAHGAAKAHRREDSRAAEQDGSKSEGCADLEVQASLPGARAVRYSASSNAGERSTPGGATWSPAKMLQGQSFEMNGGKSFETMNGLTPTTASRATNRLSWCTGTVTPTKLFNLREEWEMDRARKIQFMEEAQSQKPEDLSHELAMAEARVINELQCRLSFGVNPVSKAFSSSVVLRAFMVGREDTSEGDNKHFLKSFKCEFPLSPHSNGRMAWDVLCMLFVLYDIVMIPLVNLVFQEASGYDTAMSVIANIVWTLDIVISFLTSIVLDGELVNSLHEIARHYMKSWLIVDLLMVVPEWVFVALDSSRAGFAMMRILKIFRAIRLLRMIKMEALLQKQLKRVNSESLLYSVHLSQLMFLFLFINHLTACCWYCISNTTGDGWLEEQVLATSGRIGDGYLLALHWSITQFHGSMAVGPGNTPERVFAVAVLIIGMLSFSVFISVVTNIIFQMRQARKKTHDQQARLRSYFTRHAVSTQLMLAVKAHLALDNDMGKNCQDDSDLLEALPEQLRRSVLFEVRQATIDKHWLFTWMEDTHCTAFRDICYSAFMAMPALMGNSIFQVTDACTQMYFVELGVLRYIPIKTAPTERRTTLRTSAGPASHISMRLSQLDVGVEVCKTGWVCEPALWVQAWQTRGELIAVSNSVLLCLECSRFAQVISSYPSLHLDVTIYARWVLRELKECQIEHMMDLWKPGGRVTSVYSSEKMVDPVRSIQEVIHGRGSKAEKDRNSNSSSFEPDPSQDLGGEESLPELPLEADRWQAWDTDFCRSCA